MDAATRPVPVRLRRPGWRDPRLIVGVLLIAIAVAGTALLLRSADRTEPVYAARHALAPGAVLEPADLVVVDVRVGDGYAEPDALEPWGMTVTRPVGAGELVPVAALAEPADFDGRPVAVSVSQPLAEGVVPGALVDVWLTPADGTASRRIGEALPVSAVDEDTGGFAAGEETVYVVVPSAEVGALLDALADEGAIAVLGSG
ncbi:SAF domain-containing protein [Demequina lignilytica]|uniref:SAF domain-containing protein n=1 Tax=Demequina lignilytica TaxID=3051663 RepID=A0AB35MFW7_9MICO|nr:SAF domain-containing protein [Demequina sp. SYSU T0a273]MDN4482635.1 SAF domain-containing protein [Demequina sp. SYSU T0a273]